MKKKLVYIAGLGVIGGAFAKKLRSLDSYRVRGFDKNDAHQRASGLKSEDLGCADIVLLCLPPSSNLSFIEENASALKKGVLLANCGGVQGSAMSIASPLCSELGLDYLGAHPMAGSEKSGYDASRPDLFEGAPLILCPAPHISSDALGTAETFFKNFGFGLIQVMDAREHDQKIALVSQLPHVLAAALMIMQSSGSTALAGSSLKDMTRIAQFNIPLWVELFSLNKKDLTTALERFGNTLEHFKSALNSGNARDLSALLEESVKKHSDFFKHRS